MGLEGPVVVSLSATVSAATKSSTTKIVSLSSPISLTGTRLGCSISAAARYRPPYPSPALLQVDHGPAASKRRLDRTRRPAHGTRWRSTLGDHLFQPIAIDQKFSEQAIRIDASAHATIIILRAQQGRLPINSRVSDPILRGSKLFGTEPARFSHAPHAHYEYHRPRGRRYHGGEAVAICPSRFDVRTIQPGV